MNKLTSILGTLAVVIISVVFLAEFRPGTGVKSSVGSICAVEVNGECITDTDYWAAYQLIAPRGADAQRLRSMGIRRQTAEGLVERQLLLEDAKRLGISVSEDELSGELSEGRAHVSLPVDKARQLGYALGIEEPMYRLLAVKDRKTKKFDTKAYEREVRTIVRMSPTDFREFQRRELIASRMRDLVRARVKISEGEAKTQFQREKSTATIDYVRFDRRFYADLVVDGSDKAVEAWTSAHKEDVDKAWEGRKSQFLPECRVTRHILAKFSETATDDEKKKAGERIDEAKKRLAKGAKFADVARALSEDGSAAQGGDLGCVAKGRMVKPFEDALFAMKAGTVSEIVESQFGLHLIELETIATGEQAEKLGKAQVARERYLQLEAERLAAEGAKQVLAAVQGGKSIEDAVKAHLDGLTPKAKDAKKDGKKDGKKDAKKDDSADEASAIPENEPLTVATHPERPQVESSLPFNATGYPIDGVKPGEDVARMAFELDKPGAVLSNLVQLEGGYAMVALKEKAPASEEDWKKNREYYVAAMRSAKQNDAITAYVKRLKANLGGEIKYNGAVVEDPKAAPGEDGEAPPEE